MSSLQDAPRQTVLPTLYRSAMRFTHRHGMGTLSRINRRMFPAGQIVRLETGADFFVPPDPHFFGYIVEHERHITRLIAETVEEGDLCVDVGANIGYFTAAMAGRCGHTGRVVAYEPEAANFARLATTPGWRTPEGSASRSPGPPSATAPERSPSSGARRAPCIRSPPPRRTPPRRTSFLA